VTRDPATRPTPASGASPTPEGTSASSRSARTDVVPLLQELIRNECVNDGSAESGHETRNAALLADYLGGSGADLQRYESAPGRGSVVARIEGTDPTVPTLCYLGHLDVVPAHPAGWERDPFAGDLVDGQVWGRGSVDMLNLTASMAVAFRSLAVAAADGRFRPKGTLVFAGVADEEATGAFGTGWLFDHEIEAVRADYVITESGGIPLPTPGGIRLPVGVGEKGSAWCTLRVRGTAGHGSRPLRADNALVTAAKIVVRLSEWRGPAMIGEPWKRYVAAMGHPADVAEQLLDPDRIDDFCASTPRVGLAREAHACTHLTVAPTVMRTGQKINVIPGDVELDLDIRTMPGQGRAEVEALLADVLGEELWSHVEIAAMANEEPTVSPIDTPLYDVLSRVGQRFYPGAELAPVFSAGATDGRFYRLRGSVAYGFGMFSPTMTHTEFRSMFHGANERVDVDSLLLSTRCFEEIAREVVG
jgi:acetylornithine deacetylase/succinyl-diaminopimelate desuccinylase-like protein